MGGACGDRVKTIETIFVAEKLKVFGKEVFSGERFIINPISGRLLATPVSGRGVV